MSMFYSLCMHDRIELLTDGAYYLDDGTLIDIATKVRPSISKPFCATGRGATEVTKNFTLMATLIADRAQTVDEAINDLASAVARLGEKKEDVQNHAEILIWRPCTPAGTRWRHWRGKCASRLSASSIPHSIARRWQTTTRRRGEPAKPEPVGRQSRTLDPLGLLLASRASPPIAIDNRVSR
ncbi:hypothetical protein [Agrobacterium sp. MS2]|uniref:hypothetical protein n=1 Tax=Agrobacterium sp. MS2 TaxID=1345498 RepID=UPI0011B93663|nr:hypothetical protein [Agrobacterium sp. MS2]